MDADFFKYRFLCIDGVWEGEGHDKSCKKTYTEQSVEHLTNSPLFLLNFKRLHFSMKIPRPIKTAECFHIQTDRDFSLFSYIVWLFAQNCCLHILSFIVQLFCCFSFFHHSVFHSRTCNNCFVRFCIDYDTAISLSAFFKMMPDCPSTPEAVGFAVLRMSFGWLLRKCLAKMRLRKRILRVRQRRLPPVWISCLRLAITIAI